MDPIKLQPQRMPDLIMEQLMDWVMDGKVHMGQKLKTEELAQQLGVSRMPVREALKNLEKLGIVESIPYVGARLVQLTKDDVTQIYLMRMALEPIAGYYACKHVTDQQVEAVQQIQLRFEALMQTETASAKQIFLHNRDFHFAIYAAANLGRIYDTITMLWKNLAFCKLIYGQTYINNKEAAQRMIDEHRCYLSALRERDAERMKARLAQNLERNAVEVPEKVARYLETDDKLTGKQ